METANVLQFLCKKMFYWGNRIKNLEKKFLLPVIRENFLNLTKPHMYSADPCADFSWRDFKFYD